MVEARSREGAIGKELRYVTGQEGADVLENYRVALKRRLTAANCWLTAAFDSSSTQTQVG